MRWFKHFSDASDDLFIKKLQSRFGLAGYAWYFKTLELIARHGSPDGRLTIAPEEVVKYLGTRREQARKLLDFFRTSGKVLWRKEGENLILHCPKFGVLADNYSKRVERVRTLDVDTPAPVHPKEAEAEVEGEVDDYHIAYAGGPLRVKPDIRLRLNDKEFAHYCLEIKTLLAKKKFNWKARNKSLESDLRMIVYSLKDERKMEILTRALNITHERYDWGTYTIKAIQYMMYRSRAMPINSPVAFVLFIVQRPEELAAFVKEVAA
jgi:hypothetical protein